ncbi:15297_t:CDS:2, partial [Acaulospora colombiana]
QEENALKRSRIIQMTTDASSSTKNPVYLEFYGVNYSIPKKRRGHLLSYVKLFQNGMDELDEESGQEPILRNVHGCANPGCGKTTLLNILGDRVDKQGVNGVIRMNGHKLTKELKRFVAYCTQDDVFFSQLTVKETLDFTARLRLPRDVQKHEKLKQVENIIQLLDLSKCANTKIGNNWSR